MDGRPGTAERNEDAGDDGRVNAEPVDGGVGDVAEHRGQRHFERELRVARIAPRVSHEWGSAVAGLVDESSVNPFLAAMSEASRPITNRTALEKLSVRGCCRS